MEFTISKDEVKKLDALVKMASSVADISIQKNLYILKAESDKLKAVVYGNGNVIEFDVSICSLMPSASELFYRSLELVGRASMEWIGVFDSEWRRINGELLTRLA